MSSTIAINLEWKTEAVLDPEIQFPHPLSESYASPRAVFLTGATGFLGAYLLDALLHQTEADIYCLVRPSESASAQERLQKHLQFYGIWHSQLSPRILPVVGDLASPQLGLSSAQFNELANQIDLIFHNGALVNSAVSYEVLKPINVLGTQEVLRLAGFAKTKPVHFISTLAVFLSSAFAKAEEITESDLPNFAALQGGYKQSKCVAEELVRIAQTRGLPTHIYRPARIMGHSKTGINGNLNDFLCSLIKGCIQFGKAPDIQANINLMPVDYVSQAIVHLARHQPFSGQAFNLLNPNPIVWNDLCNQMRTLGYQLESVSLNQWMEHLQQKISQDPDNKLYASLLILLSSPINIFSKKPPVRTASTLEQLAKAAVICPTVTVELMGTYFKYFQKTGYLPAPETQFSSSTAAPTSPATAQAQPVKKVGSGFWKSIRSNVKSKQQTFEIKPAPRDRPLPLSFGQERLWLIEQLQPNSVVHNLMGVFRIRGPLDRSKLEKSIQEIVRRHAILRTTFPNVDGQPVQLIAPELILDIPMIDLASLAPSEQETELRRVAMEEAQTPFDLVNGPLIRFKLLHLGATDHALVRTVHHIINDVWTDTVRTRELATLYEAFAKGEPSPLADLPVQYADFAYAQRQWLQGEVLKTQLDYWQKQLEPKIPQLQLPTNTSHGHGPNYQGAAQVLVLEPSLSSAIKSIGSESGVSLFVTLLAAYKVLLNRYSGQEDIILVCPVANRKQPVTKKLIGYFSNIVFVRTSLVGEPTFRSVIERVSQATLGAFEHQDIPCQQLAETFNVPSTTLSRAMFTLQNVPKQPRELAPGIEFGLEEMEEGNSNFDLSLAMKEKGDSLMGIFRYKTSLFEQDTITQLLENFRTLFQELVANLDRPLASLPQFAEFAAQAQGFPVFSRSQADTPYVAPQDEMEFKLVDIWQSILNVDKIGINDNFFDIGGRSLAMIQMYSKLKGVTDREIAVGELFKHPTIAGMADYLKTI